MVKQVILACRPLDHLPGKEPWPPTPAKFPVVHVTARSVGLMGEIQFRTVSCAMSQEVVHENHRRSDGTSDRTELA